MKVEILDKNEINIRIFCIYSKFESFLTCSYKDLNQEIPKSIKDLENIVENDEEWRNCNKNNRIVIFNTTIETIIKYLENQDLVNFIIKVIIDELKKGGENKDFLFELIDNLLHRLSVDQIQLVITELFRVSNEVVLGYIDGYISRNKCDAFDEPAKIHESTTTTTATTTTLERFDHVKSFIKIIYVIAIVDSQLQNILKHLKHTTLDSNFIGLSYSMNKFISLLPNDSRIELRDLLVQISKQPELNIMESRLFYVVHQLIRYSLTTGDDFQTFFGSDMISFYIESIMKRLTTIDDDLVNIAMTRDYSTSDMMLIDLELMISGFSSNVHYPKMIIQKLIDSYSHMFESTNWKERYSILRMLNTQNISYENIDFIFNSGFKSMNIDDQSSSSSSSLGNDEHPLVRYEYYTLVSRYLSSKTDKFDLCYHFVKMILNRDEDIPILKTCMLNCLYTMMILHNITTNDENQLNAFHRDIITIICKYASSNERNVVRQALATVIQFSTHIGNGFIPYFDDTIEWFIKTLESHPYSHELRFDILQSLSKLLVVMGVDYSHITNNRFNNGQIIQRLLTTTLAEVDVLSVDQQSLSKLFDTFRNFCQCPGFDIQTYLVRIMDCVTMILISDEGVQQWTGNEGTVLELDHFTQTYSRLELALRFLPYAFHCLEFGDVFLPKNLYKSMEVEIIPFLVNAKSNILLQCTMETNLTKEYLDTLDKEKLIELILSSSSNQKDNKNNNNNSSNNKQQQQQPKKKKDKKRKRTSEIDFDKCYKRYIALKVAYLGWDYHGFAAQQITEETIEGHLIRALQKTCLINDIKNCNYSKYALSGRTDKGVSAFGQVISLYVRSNLTEGNDLIPPTVIDDEAIAKKKANLLKNKKTHEEFQFVKMLNGVLPPYIRVLGWSPIPFHFNARFSTLYRTYKYFFDPSNLDLNLMKEAGKSYIGEHDFSNFCKIDLESVKSFTRVILSFDIQPVESGDFSTSGMYVATICGYAFLWHQIRCMMAMLFLIGQKKFPTTIIADLLDLSKGIVKPPYEMASEVPLVLFDCGYEDLNFIYDKD
ncbi:tRNA pseudouridylate synthase [Heterostelium album PN500]|uniref:tRNA pseudouridylate synthase n=1 Tax=Heterostelium pallidum (strain ATCC 26659 / Pp 5 / PN500) TaxID=670386 RepID=D3BUW1_HETP5|nr:tRNA pseudouridylate synthase [Heterostelium album PN500]EFA74899.1 tRNA pseudouridylate synthase [Heterostelium album PN500]|eukprot:XP_020427033.1 tRNA pseudouridylate synthase [Heterostelium album PN500]